MKELSKEAIQTISDLTKKAAPHRIQISDVLNKKMLFLRQSFVQYHIQDINKKKDPEAYKEAKIEAEKTFRLIKDLYYYDGLNTDQCRLAVMLEKIAKAIAYMRYIGDTELLDAELAKLNMTITVPALDAHDIRFAEENIPEEFQKLFKSAHDVQTQICEQFQAIKVNIFQSIPDELRYDPKTNKSGIKSEAFNKLTTLEATKQKSETAAEKKLESMEDSIHDNIDSSLAVKSIAQEIAS